MAHRKAGGTARNLRDSNAQYLGVKLYVGEVAKPGMIIVRQRGTRFVAGRGVDTGKDHTLFAIKAGNVAIKQRRKTGFNNRVSRVHVVEVI